MTNQQTQEEQRKAYQLIKAEAVERLADYLRGYTRGDALNLRSAQAFRHWEECARAEVVRRGGGLVIAFDDELLQLVADGRINVANLIEGMLEEIELKKGGQS
jgi:hypothetical protein